MAGVPAALGKDHRRAAGPAGLIIEVSDADDPRLSDFRDLTDVALRSRIEPPLGLFLAEGALVIDRAVAAGYQMRSALVSAKWVHTLPATEAPVYVGREALLQEITGFHVHRGALASMQRRSLPAVADVLASASRVVVIEDIVSHTNLGAIFRSAAALGMDAVLITPSSADPLYRRSVRVSMGGVFAMPWTRLSAWPDDLELLRTNGFAIAALTPDEAATDIGEVPVASYPKLALLLGTEGEGLSEAAMRAADLRLRIPMSAGVDSINVAAAAAVAFYALQAR